MIHRITNQITARTQKHLERLLRQAFRDVARYTNRNQKRIGSVASWIVIAGSIVGGGGWLWSVTTTIPQYESANLVNFASVAFTPNSGFFDIDGARDFHHLAGDICHAGSGKLGGVRSVESAWSYTGGYRIPSDPPPPSTPLVRSVVPLRYSQYAEGTCFQRGRTSYIVMERAVGNLTTVDSPVALNQKGAGSSQLYQYEVIDADGSLLGKDDLDRLVTDLTRTSGLPEIPRSSPEKPYAAIDRALVDDVGHKS